ncbi:MAG TPA: sigma-70 family RNA polymerase sigma factor [bacterium]|nr:sigma-70 family RNA polymerase sigma factor [bacterium]
MAHDNCLRSYFKAISCNPLLTQAEEVRLARLSRKGNSEARRKLVESNLLFVAKIAREYLNQGLPMPDLIQEGNLGLMHALEKFDERLGFRLTTYASWWIRLSIKRAVEQKSRQIRIPSNKLELLRKMRAFQSCYEKMHGQSPSVEVIAKEFKIPKTKIERVIGLDTHVTSFDLPTTEDGVAYELLLSSEDSVLPSETIHMEQMREKLERAMEVLSVKERKVLTMRYGLQDEGSSASLREVGKQMGMSPEGVRRIENKALSKLRRPHVRAYVENFV